MKKEIINKNQKGQYHGYQEGYHLTYISYRYKTKNNKRVGYCEWHGMKETIFRIK